MIRHVYCLDQHPNPMRYSILIPILAITVPVNAQLTNGSFESDGTPSLTGWEWTCNEPGLQNSGAPGSGEWSATKEPGHAKGCFPSFIYQRLPEAENGTILTLSGWVRCGEEEPCIGGFLSAGRVHDGVFELDNSATSQFTSWEYVSISNVVQNEEGDTAIVVLSGGFIGGPISPSPSYFDGITLSIALSVEQVPAAEGPLYRLSPDGQSVAVHATSEEGIQLHDAMGKLHFDGKGNGSGWRTIPLPDGAIWLMVTVEGKGMRRSQRLVLPK